MIPISGLKESTKAFSCLNKTRFFKRLNNFIER